MGRASRAAKLLRSMVFTECELRRSPMLANVSVLSAVNPIVVYSVLGFYGILIFAVLLYVYNKFSGAARLLDSLKKDWESAATTHKDMLTQAREHVSKLTPIPTALNAVAG